MDKETKEFVVMFSATFLGTAVGMHLWMRYRNPIASYMQSTDKPKYQTYQFK